MTRSTEIMEKIPPYNLEAEQAVLGSVLLSNQAIYLTGLTDADFYKAAHRKIYLAMEKLSERDSAVDLVTLREYLSGAGDMENVGGSLYLSQLLDAVPSSANVEFYSEIVRQASIRRKIIEAGRSMALSAYEDGATGGEVLEKAEEVVFAIGGAMAARSSSTVLNDAIRETFTDIERLYEQDGEISGLSTGYPDLDRKLGGLNKGDLIYLAARPSMGKTSLGVNISANVCSAGGCVLFFSLEMSEKELTKRLISQSAQVNLKKFRSGKLTQSDFGYMTTAAGDMSEWKLYIYDDMDVTLADMRSEIMRIGRREEKIDLVVVDYLQYMRSARSKNYGSRDQEISDYSRGLKNIAKKFEVPVLALSQLNRGVELRTDKRPMLADLRDSGSIEQDGDVIMFIYREAQYNENADDKMKSEILVRKNRQGPCGKILLRFIKEFAVFRNYTEG